MPPLLYQYDPLPTALSAALADYKVVTTASPNNFDLLRSLDASTVFSYRSPDVIAQIKIAMGDSLRQAFDAAGSGKNSEHNTLKVLGLSRGGDIVLVAPSFPGGDEPDGRRTAA